MTENKLKFAMIGSGNISNTYIQAMEKIKEGEICAVISRSGKKPDNCEKQLEIASSLKDLKSAVDAVIITTPNGTHCELAIEAADLGKHVLTEKVLEVTREKMDRMIAYCREKGVTLGVSFQRRMSPDNIAVKKLLDQKTLGRIYAADLYVKYYRGEEYYNSADYRGNLEIDGGGPFMQQASHNIDIYCWFFGLPVNIVSSLSTCCHDIEAEDHGYALLRYNNGMTGTITASTITYPGYPAKLEIHTEKGTVILENDIITDWQIEGVPNPAAKSDIKIHSGSNNAQVSDTAGHEAILRDFITSVRGNQEPAVSGESARNATELILRIYENTIN